MIPTSPKPTQTLYVVLPHHLQQVDRTNEVVLIVFQRLTLRLTDVLVSSEVDHRFKRSVFGEHFVQRRSIQKRALHVTITHEAHIHELQLSLRRFCNLLDGFEASHSTTQQKTAKPYLEFERLSKIVTL